MKKIKQAVKLSITSTWSRRIKEKNNQAQQANEALRNENEQLKAEHHNWQERLRSLLGRIDNV